MVRLYRAMQEDAQGLPILGASSRSLGVRPGRDVAALLPGELVHPKAGGLSVSPDDPTNLPYYRRPPRWQGTGKDDVWEIDSSHLGPELVYRQDPINPGHGFIEPVQTMTLDEYQNALSATQMLWQKI
jgi:hypothetical protein